MNSTPIGLAPGGETAMDPAPLVLPARNWTRWLGPLVSVAILVVVFHELGRMNLRADMSLLPHGIGFWLVFLIYYCTAPLSEWLLFHRLWQIPASGFVALLRKRISNELLFGYVGEVYFYAWARQQGRITAAPFGAIKDVAVLSAICGNVVTLVMLPFAQHLLRELPLGIDRHMLDLSIGIIVAGSLIPMLISRRLFSLPPQELWIIAAVHMLRIVVSLGLSAYLWHLVLPGVALGWWFLLATLRQLVSRLPFVPNKDVVFAGLAVFILGQQAELAGLLAVMATIMLSTHLAVGVVIGLGGLFGQQQEA